MFIGDTGRAIVVKSYVAIAQYSQYTHTGAYRCKYTYTDRRTDCLSSSVYEPIIVQVKSYICVYARGEGLGVAQ